MRNLFIFIFICGFLVVAAPGQTDGKHDLVQGDPPLTQSTIDKSVDFFQWVLGGNFTADERSAYEQYLAQLWRSRDAQSIKTICEVVAARDKLAGQPAEKLQQLHQQLQSGLLKEFRAQPTDPLSRILLGAYERVQGSGSRIHPGNRENPQEADAASMIGEWEESHVGNSSYDTGTGGSYTGRESMKNIIRFSADGSYHSAYVTQSDAFGCTAHVYFGGTGTFRLTDGTVHLNETKRRKISRNTCGMGENEDRELTPGTYVYAILLGQNEQVRTMTLVVDGKRHTFRKVEGKGLLVGQ